MPASWMILTKTRLDLLQLGENLHEKSSCLEHRLVIVVLAVDDLIGPGVGTDQVRLSQNVFRQEHFQGSEEQIVLVSTTASDTDINEKIS